MINPCPGLDFGSSFLHAGESPAIGNVTLVRDPEREEDASVQEHRHGTCHPVGSPAGVHSRRRRGFRKRADQIHEGGLGPNMDRLVAYPPPALRILFGQQAALGRDRPVIPSWPGCQGLARGSCTAFQPQPPPVQHGNSCAAQQLRQLTAPARPVKFRA
jgi:hypothetical protein